MIIIFFNQNKFYQKIYTLWLINLNKIKMIFFNINILMIWWYDIKITKFKNELILLIKLYFIFYIKLFLI